LRFFRKRQDALYLAFKVLFASSASSKPGYSIWKTRKGHGF